MEKQVEIRIFTEELWANIDMMQANSEITTADVLQALDIIRQRLQKRLAAEGGMSGCTPMS